MITTVRDTNTTTKDIKKAVLLYLAGQAEGLRRGLVVKLVSTAKLAKRLNVAPRPLRKVLAELHEEGKIEYVRTDHGWKLP